ncbi:adenylyl cyclase-associated protein, partial [Reticulomyxa filosa]
MGALIKQGFDNVLELVQKLPNAKKPEQVQSLFFLNDYFEERGGEGRGEEEHKKIRKVSKLYKDLVAFLGRAGDAIAKADNARYRGKDFKKACYEVLTLTQWVVMTPPSGSPLGHCDQQTQACDFNLNRVLKEAKDDKTKAFVQALKKVCKAQTEFIKEHFKTGLTWNPK